MPPSASSHANVPDLTDDLAAPARAHHASSADDRLTALVAEAHNATAGVDPNGAFAANEAENGGNAPFAADLADNGGKAAFAAGEAIAPAGGVNPYGVRAAHHADIGGNGGCTVDLAIPVTAGVNPDGGCAADEAENSGNAAFAAGEAIAPARGVNPDGARAARQADIGGNAALAADLAIPLTARVNPDGIRAACQADNGGDGAFGADLADGAGVAEAGSLRAVIPERTRRLLYGPILPTLLRLAVPSIVVVVVQATSSAVDAFWLGRLGPEVLAGVALVFPTWMLMVTMSAGGIGGGIASSVARALGGGRRADADELVTHSLALSIGLSAVFSAVVLLAGPGLYQAMAGAGANGPVLTAAVAYSNAVFAGAIAVWLVNALASLLRGSGEMVVPAVVIVGGELLHLALAPALIFGLGPFPALGVSGAGISLVTSYVLRAVALGAFLLARRAAVTLPIGRLRLRRGVFWEILRVGLPGALNTVLTNATVMAITGLVGPSGVFALAGYGLAARLEYLQIPLVFGFGTALVTMVGTNVGAGQVQRARHVAWIGASVAAAVTGTVGLIAAFAPAAWLGLFTSDPAVLSIGATYLRIVGPTFGFFGLGLALYFAAQGAGHLTWPLVAGFGRLALAVAGGWLAIFWLHGGLPWLFAAVAVAFVAFGLAQAFAVRWVIRAPVSTV